MKVQRMKGMEMTDLGGFVLRLKGGTSMEYDLKKKSGVDGGRIAVELLTGQLGDWLQSKFSP